MKVRKLTQSQVDEIMSKMANLVASQMQIIEDEIIRETKETLHLWLNQEVSDDESDIF